MPPLEICEYHAQLTQDISQIKTDIAVIKTDQGYIKDKVCSHVEQGEEKGGFRDRLIILEEQVSALKKAEWTRVVGAGIIGGLIGNIAPEAVSLLTRWITGH